MPTEKEISIVQKATVYDLTKILQSGNKDNYTVDEITALLDAYIKGTEQ